MDDSGLLNFKDEPLMSCRLCHFPRSQGATSGRNYIYWRMANAILHQRKIKEIPKPVGVLI
jgi:hypothetical protein